jgi:hypothetical protein
LILPNNELPKLLLNDLLDDAANQLGGVIAMIPACSTPEAIEISATDCIQRIDQKTAHHEV